MTGIQPAILMLSHQKFEALTPWVRGKFLNALDARFDELAFHVIQSACPPETCPTCSLYRFAFCFMTGYWWELNNPFLELPDNHAEVIKDTLKVVIAHIRNGCVKEDCWTCNLMRLILDNDIIIFGAD